MSRRCIATEPGDHTVTQQELRRGSDRKKRIVFRILASRVQSQALSKKQQRTLFLEQYFANIPVEDLEGREEQKMAQAALDHLGFGAKRAKNKPLLRIFNPTEEEHGYVSTFTIIEMVNDDMPFLVDSISAAINRLDMSVHITVHPIIRVLRDSRGHLKSIAKPGQDSGRLESYIRLAVDRETDPDRLALIVQEIDTVLADVRLAVRDWKKMRKKMAEARQTLQAAPRDVDNTLHEENQAFLQWLVDDHFTFLGYREYKLSDRNKKLMLEPVAGSALGLLSRKKNGSRKIQLTPQMRRVKRARDWLVLTKANSRSTVHRSAYLDYVGIKVYDASGEVCGERRFIGLFASTAYSEPPGNIPLLRYKIARIYERAHMKPVGHRGKALMHIINTYPRDELFNASIADLARTTIGIMNLQDRRRVKFFLRRDKFRRFFSCLVFVPKEKYTTAVRRRIEAILKEAFGGSSVDSSVKIADSALARVHIVVRTRSGDRPHISIQKIEAQIANVVITWADRLRDELSDKFGQDVAGDLYRRYQDVFPLGYREDVLPSEACSDITRIENMLAKNTRRSVELYTPEGGESGHMHCMLYGFDEPLALSAVMPLLEDMGVDVYTEHPYELRLPSGQSFWIQDFQLRHGLGASLDVAVVASRFEDCFLQVLEGHAETDGLNRLILSARLDWRQTALLRCYAKHMQQLGIPFSQAYMEDVLVAHSKLVRRLIEQFETQFDPTLPKGKREAALISIGQGIERSVAKARNVDEDRILNAFAEAVSATLRTNYFQTNEDGSYKPYFSIKLDPSQLREAPFPRPKFEVFVYSPDVEGVHLRAGDIARGGIRWSDRREDFRTEVLGLMKAQVVKNTVIVPTGAKGGFFPKRPPAGDRDAILKFAIDCYKTFVSGLAERCCSTGR
jgi:glutamate dehydrogenase